MEGKLHVVIDTNVIVSSLLNVDGPCGEVFLLVEDRVVIPVVCEEIMQEYIKCL